MVEAGAKYGPGNPHPLSVVRTELVWEGKYDEFGNRREVDAASLAMPLQRIETVDEPRARTEAQGQLFDAKKSHLDDFRNMLIWGDNKLVLASLLKEFRGTVDLIYIDPPFDVGVDFSMLVPIGDGSDSVEKDQSVLEMVAYRDMWGRGTDSYLHMMYERLSLMRALLADTGCIYVHCDWRMNSFIRLVLDEVFSPEYYRNEIRWRRQPPRGAKAISSQFARSSDTIMFYSKLATMTWKGGYKEYSPQYIHDKFRPDASGRLFRIDTIGTYSKESLARFEADGRIYHYPSGKLGLIRYLDEAKGEPLTDIWSDVPEVNSQADERLDYATQKPEALLERIIMASTEAGALVADLFCGSGTTGAVAERLGRRWLMADLGRFAVHTSRKRLIELQRQLHDEGKPYRAFDVFNLGRYERQWWQKERLRGADEEHRRIVLEFYKAEILSNPPSPLLHGRKGPAFCHVDGIDGIFSRREVRSVVEAAQASGAKEVACLAWEFEMDLRMECDALEREFGVHIKLIPIPREIMEKNRKEPPPFLEVATLEAEPVYRKVEGKRVVDIKLTRFIPSLAEVPTRELEELKKRAVKSGLDFIDFWAVDFDFTNGGPFNHHWQDYRTRKDRSLKTVSEQAFEYPKKGRYNACVKVVDIFGCDTSITVEVVVD